MAATPIVPTKSTRVTGSPGTPVAGALAAVDATNGNSFVNTGREILIVTTDANARTITFNDAAGTQVGAAVNLVASKTYVFGPFKRYDYGDPVVFKASNNAVTAAVITLDELASFGSNR